MNTILVILSSISAISSCAAAIIANKKVSAYYKWLKVKNLDDLEELYKLRAEVEKMKRKK